MFVYKARSARQIYFFSFGSHVFPRVIFFVHPSLTSVICIKLVVSPVFHYFSCFCCFLIYSQWLIVCTGSRRIITYNSKYLRYFFVVITVIREMHFDNNRFKTRSTLFITHRLKFFSACSLIFFLINAHKML